VFLKVTDLDAGYGFLQVLRQLNIQVDKGEYVCLVGPNGAGKSTTMKAIAGLVKPKAGGIEFEGRSIGGMSGNKVVKQGVVYVSESMNLFTNMTVQENLEMGAFTVTDKHLIQEKIEFVYSLFTRLEERRNQLAGTMSGGERKMLAIGRGIMSNPKLMLVDEPSFGLAPQLTEAVFDSLETLRQKG
jgi:ABC-type branched-subunit amino acid transport system ATPase component